MALPDLTGQNIQDTYKRVIHTDGTNLYDGTGSLFTVVSASYAVTSSHEVTLEVSIAPKEFKLDTSLQALVKLVPN